MLKQFILFIISISSISLSYSSQTSVLPKGEELILFGNFEDLNKIKNNFRTNYEINSIFSLNDQLFLNQKKLTKWANAIAIQSKENDSRWISEKSRLFQYIKKNHLQIKTEMNSFVIHPELHSKNVSFFDKFVGKIKSSFTSIDDYTSKQWYLFNSDVILRKITWDTLDLSKYIKGIKEASIQINENSNLGKDILVAVLDSGLDINHPDFIDKNGESRLFSKKENCEKIELYKTCTLTKSKKICDKEFLTKENDLDGNGFPLDCYGWSVVESGIGSPIVNDNISHGTHVAGIIAAADNAFGITGVAPKAKILPVRVINEDPSGDNEKSEGQKTGTSVVSQVARGLVYALKNKADIINMSLGWNGRSDSILVSDLVDAATQQGTFVVAAAGNDGTNALVYPCQYKNVICVGAHQNDGLRIEFSNYGNGVDISAPGMNIFSTIPNDIEAEIFTEKSGYDYKDGTSMATPIVSGAIARLLSDGVSREDLRAKLYLGATQLDKNNSTDVLSGLLNIKNSLKVNLLPYFIPERKGIYPAILQEGSDSFKIKFSLKNIGSDLTRPVSFELSIKDVKNLSNKVTLNQTTFSIPSLKKNEVFSTILEFTKTSDKLDSEIEIIAKTKDQNLKQTFQIPILLSTYFSKSEPLSNSQKLPLINSNDFDKDSILFSIKNLDQNSNIDYFAFSPGSDENSLNIQFLKQENNQYRVYPKKEFNFGRAVSPRTIQRLDVNLDGKSEYFVTFVSDKIRGEAVLSFLTYYLDENGNEVLPHFVFSGKTKPTSLFQLNNFQWLNIGTRLTPAWINDSATVAVDELKLAYHPLLNPNPELNKKARIFYHDPAATEGLRTIPELYLEGRNPLYFFDQKTIGEINFLAEPKLNENKNSYFYGSIQNNLKINFYNFETKPSRNLTLGINKDLPLTPLSSLESVPALLVQKNMGTPSQNFSLLKNEGKTISFNEIQINSQYPEDAVFRGVASFYGVNRFATYAMAMYDLYFKDESTSTNTLSTSLRRYTFLPSEIFNRQFFPAVIKDQNTLLPAVRIPDGMGAYPGSEVIIPEKDPLTSQSTRLYRPAKFRYLVEGCDELSAIPSQNANPYFAVYFCGDSFIRIPYSF